MNPFLNRQTKTKIGETGNRSEKKTAKRLGGRQTPASGAMAGAKGDIELPAFLVEAKSTIKESISLKREWLTKISGEALGKNKAPCVAITFTTENGLPKPRGKWILIREQDFKELTDGA